MSFQTLILERNEAVTLIRLNRPEALNALNGQLMDELTAVLDGTEADAGVRCVVITGSERAFAAGADIKEMVDLSYTDMVQRSGALQDSFTAIARIPSRAPMRDCATLQAYPTGARRGQRDHNKSRPARRNESRTTRDASLSLRYRPWRRSAWA